MITAGTDLRVLVATRPVDFRKQADGLAAIVQAALGADPFCGAVYVFRSKRLDRVKLLWWDGTGICLMTKRLESSQFRWPPIEDGMMKLSAVQLSALLEGGQWARVERREIDSTECYAMMLRHDDSGSQSMLRASTESSTLWFIFGKTHRATMDVSDTLPDDIDALRALLLAERASRAAIVAERDKLVVRNARLEAIIAEIRRAHYGRKSERITDDQLSLALEELETSLAKAEAEDEKTDPALKAAATRKRRASRHENLDHLPHEEVVIEPESKACPCCGGELHVIGEDTSKRLDKVPAKVRVIVTRRPKYACRSCEKTGADTVAGVIQAPAPARLIEGGLPTEAMVADVVVSKHADHLPLYRQSQILARHGVKIERSTLAQWVGAAAAELQPLHDHLIDLLKASPRLFCDETRCPVLDPGAGKTKTGYLWALARDDRPWGGGWDAGMPRSTGEVVRRRWPTPMRRVAAASTPPSCSTASTASCRSTATRSTRSWPRRHGLVGR